MNHIVKRIYFSEKVFLSLITILIIATIGFFFISFQSSVRLEQLNFYNKTQNIYETFEKIDGNSCYKVDGLCTVHLKFHNEFEKCDCAVKTDKLMVQDTSDKLSQNEVLLSSNLAAKYRLNIGDNIYLSSSVFDSFSVYKIKELTDACYGLKDIDFLNPSGLIIFGYNQRIASLSKRFISFVDDSEKNSIAISSNTIVYPVQSSKAAITGFVVGFSLLYFFGFSLIVTAILFSTFSEFLIIQKNKKKYGENIGVLNKETLVITAPLFSMPLIIFLIGLLTLLFIKSVYSFYMMLALFLLFSFAIFVSQLVFMIKIRRI